MMNMANQNCANQYQTIQCMPMKLAHAYVPYQCMSCIYPPIIGLSQGTIFPELNRPYGADPEYAVDQ